MARHRGQGAFEYILMLSGVLLVVITITYMMQGSLAQADNTLDAQMKAAGIALDPTYYTPGAKPQFLPSTPADGTGSTSRPNISAAITVKDAALNNLQFNWNGTNYSLYDQSLVLAYNFDDAPSTGDNARKAADVSTNGNNGIIYGNTLGLWHMDEASGSNVNDESRFGGNASCYNMNGLTGITSCNWTPGRSGSGIDLDGNNDYLLIPNNAGTNARGSQLGMEMWFFSRNITAGYTFLLKKQTPGYSIYLSPTGHLSELIYYYDSTFTICQTSAPLSSNMWYHVVATFTENSSLKIYINGALNTTCGPGYNKPLGSNSGGVSLGYMGWWSSNNAYFNGTIDEVVIANRSFDATEVLARYNAGKAKHANWDPNGKWNSAMKFDGTDDRVDLGDFDDLPVLNFNSGNWSAFAWVRPDSQRYNTGIFGEKTAADQDFMLGITVDNKPFLTWVSNPAHPSISNVTSASSLNDRKWHHIGAARNGGSITLYVDGRAAGTDATVGAYDITGNNWFARWSVGAYFSGCCTTFDQGHWGGFFNGSIDEVRVWNRALTATEIEMNYRSNLYKYTPNAWLFDYRNESLGYGTYNYTVYASGGYRKEGASETRTVRYCQVPWPC